MPWLLLLACAEPIPVQATFTAEVVTVAQTPFGYDDTIRTAGVEGSFLWNGGAVDEDFEDAMRGEYPHLGNGDFEIDVEGTVIRGTARPTIQVEDFPSSDTFRFVDGADPLLDFERVMTVDGEDRPDVKLWVAMTDQSGEAFQDDAIPLQWPITDVSNPHTFSLSDDGGTLLLQFLSVN